VKGDFLKIGMVGGTGNMGRGLAIRWAVKHEIYIGSRSLEKAQRIAKELEKVARGFYQAEMKGSIKGRCNADAVKESEVVIVTLPPEATIPAMMKLRMHLHPKQIVVSTVVPMKKRKGLFFCTALSAEEIAGYEEKSAAEVIQEIVKPTPVASALHTVPAAYLNNIDSVLNIDVLIASNDDLAITRISKLIRDIPNFRPLRVGPLENSSCIESITPLLLNAAILNNLKDPSIRVVPWIPTSYEAYEQRNLRK
jgi:NADPH-dependent F420 reductase